jgi:hypothetical protein
MRETSHRARLSAELLTGLAREMGVEHFDGCLRVEVQVLSQVDLGNATAPDETKQAIVAKLLSYTVGHARASSHYGFKTKKEGYTWRQSERYPLVFATLIIRFCEQNLNI